MPKRSSLPILGAAGSAVLALLLLIGEAAGEGLPEPGKSGAERVDVSERLLLVVVSGEGELLESEAGLGLKAEESVLASGWLEREDGSAVCPLPELLKSGESFEVTTDEFEFVVESWRPNIFALP